MKEIKVGDILEGTVVRVYPKYAIMLFEEGRTGLLHISELSNSFIRNFTSFVQVGNIYKVKVTEINAAENSMRVSLKQMSNAEKHMPLAKVSIDSSRISFLELERHLPSWIEEENAKGENNDRQNQR